MKNIISVSLSKELLAKINQERKLASRSAYIEFLLNKSLEKENGV